jgi:hypothetical protein
MLGLSSFSNINFESTLNQLLIKQSLNLGLLDYAPGRSSMPWLVL